ncbi:MAG: mechanosensitive ion channel family protein, partial [Halofilum sp. (in: g-proteobacteria)]
WFRDWTAWAGDHRWLVSLMAIFVVVLVIDVIHRGVIRALARRASRNDKLWDDTIIDAMGAPIRVALWVLGLAASFAIIGSNLNLPVDLSQYIPRATGIGLVVALSWFGFRLARGVEEALLERYVHSGGGVGPDRTTVDGIGKVLRALAIVVGLLLVLQACGVSISGLLAVGGVGGLAIGFAARDLLANFFGSIMIHTDGPFRVGDWIRSPDRDIEGVVEYVGWRMSRLRTFDMRPLYVPNSVFVNAVVENPSRMTHRRVYETLGIRYDDIAVLGDIVGEIREMIEAREEVDLRQPVIINFLEYGASSLTVMIYFLVTETRWVAYHALKQELMLAIADVIARHGAQVALPTTTLHVASTPGGEPVQAPEVVDTDSGAHRSADTVYGQVAEGQAEGAGSA